VTDIETNEWATAEHAEAYLERAPRLPRRDIAYGELLEVLPANPAVCWTWAAATAGSWR
jgi:hypothetical protein